MPKSTHIYMLSVAVLVSIISFGVFQIARSDDNAETVPSSSPSPDDPKENVGDLALQITSLLPKDAIPAILDPQFVSVEDVPLLFSDDELVIGVSINGDARAYTIGVLGHHEIVNDVVGGESIAVTW